MYPRAVNAFSATHPGSWPVGPDERARQWPDLVRTIPQMRTYVRRTTPDIPVVRLAQR